MNESIRSELDKEPKKILIDTGAWVDFLSSSKGILGGMVATAIDANQATMCGVVITELLQSATSEAQQAQLSFLFSSIESLPMSEATMYDAGYLLQQVRGVTPRVPLSDALIAAVAIKQSVPVLTADPNFALFKGLEIIHA